MLVRVLAACLALAGTGCANLVVGPAFDAQAARQIEPLRTTRAEVHQLLGAPLRSERLGTMRLDVHKRVTPGATQLVVVSYRDADEVVHVTIAD
jgi:hypothetical protein